MHCRDRSSTLAQILFWHRRFQAEFWRDRFGRPDSEYRAFWGPAAISVYIAQSLCPNFLATQRLRLRVVALAENPARSRPTPAKHARRAQNKNALSCTARRDHAGTLDSIATKPAPQIPSDPNSLRIVPSTSPSDISPVYR